MMLSPSASRSLNVFGLMRQIMSLICLCFCAIASGHSSGLYLLPAGTLVNTRAVKDFLVCFLRTMQLFSFLVRSF